MLYNIRVPTGTSNYTFAASENLFCFKWTIVYYDDSNKIFKVFFTVNLYLPNAVLFLLILKRHG